jgi:transaldolase
MVHANILSTLKIKIFADGADEKSIRELYPCSHIRGFTTNPSLMRKAGVDDYERFAKNLLEYVQEKPLSFEVFSDEFPEMMRQARTISSWGKNVYVKIPITNTRGESAAPLIATLLKDGLKLNITAMLPPKQVDEIRPHFTKQSQAFISIFAGRVADTGLDPEPIMRHAVAAFKDFPLTEILWASCRELFNIFMADRTGCHIITVTHDLLKKLPLLGRDLDEYSLDTVKMFYNDARDSGYVL